MIWIGVLQGVAIFLGIVGTGLLAYCLTLVWLMWRNRDRM